MDVVFHSLFLWPIQAAVEFLFLAWNQWTDHHVGVTIVLLSLTVNTLVLPLYLVADRWQKEEKALLARMAPKVAAIRAVFRGDERQMILNTYYRQCGYHPLFSLRSSVGLLMQIPFFLAAYNLLSHADGLRASVWFLQDLSLPDRLFHVGEVAINVLPLAMTALNLLSAAVYAKNLRVKDNLQLFVLAAVFLVLLYNSPSGLVLYWTINNLFSLVKNLVGRSPRPGRVFHGLALGLVAFFAGWQAWTTRHVSVAWAVGAGLVLVVVWMLPALWKALVRAIDPAPNGAALRQEKSLLLASSTLLFSLAGLAVPLLFVAASPADVPSGWAQVFRTALQALSLFVLLPWGLWALASNPVRRLLAWSVAFEAVLALLNAFLVPPSVSFNASFTLTDPQGLSSLTSLLVSGAVILAAVAAVTALALLRRTSWLTAVLALGTASLTLVAGFTAATLPAPAPAAPAAAAATSVAPVFHLTRKGHNQFLIFLDGFPAVQFPEMLASVPGLGDDLDGFAWYANTVSYAPNTFQTTPAMMGGPAYTPEAINERRDEPLAFKHREAQRVLPVVMAAAGERVVLSDPSYIDFNGDTSDLPYRGLPGVDVVNLHGVYTDLYFREHPYHTTHRRSMRLTTTFWPGSVCSGWRLRQADRPSTTTRVGGLPPREPTFRTS